MNIERLVCWLRGHDWWKVLVEDWIGTRKGAILQTRCRRCGKIQASIPTYNVVGSSNVAIGCSALSAIATGLSPTTFYPPDPISAYGTYVVLPNVLTEEE